MSVVVPSVPSPADRPERERRCVLDPAKRLGGFRAAAGRKTYFVAKPGRLVTALAACGVGFLNSAEERHGYMGWPFPAAAVDELKRLAFNFQPRITADWR
jgi:hypothetical protein